MDLGLVLLAGPIRGALKIKANLHTFKMLAYLGFGVSGFVGFTRV